MTVLPEDYSRLVLLTAVNEGRCSEMLECLFEGGSVTVQDGLLVLVTGEQLDQLGEMFK